MALHSLVTLDLNQASDYARSRFYAVLAAKGWDKHPRLTTIWTIDWNLGATEAGATQAIRAHLAEAATASGIQRYDVCLMHSANRSIEWSVAPQLGGLGYGIR